MICSTKHLKKGHCKFEINSNNNNQQKGNENSSGYYLTIVWSG
jgi:hypothetical protein